MSSRASSTRSEQGSPGLCPLPHGAACDPLPVGWASQEQEKTQLWENWASPQLCPRHGDTLTPGPREAGLHAVSKSGTTFQELSSPNPTGGGLGHLVQPPQKPVACASVALACLPPSAEPTSGWPSANTPGLSSGGGNGCPSQLFASENGCSLVAKGKSHTTSDRFPQLYTPP